MSSFSMLFSKKNSEELKICYNIILYVFQTTHNPSLVISFETSFVLTYFKYSFTANFILFLKNVTFMVKSQLDPVKKS